MEDVFSHSDHIYPKQNTVIQYNLRTHLIISSSSTACSRGDSSTSIVSLLISGLSHWMLELDRGTLEKVDIIDVDRNRGSDVVRTVVFLLIGI